MKPKIALLILVICLFYVEAHSNIIVVDSHKTVNTLKKGVEAAKKGDTILVKKGHYTSLNTIINKQLIILGENYPTLDAHFKEEVLTIKSDGVVLNGFIIQNSATGDLRDFAGVRVSSSKNITISNNHFVDNFFSVYLSDSHNVKVFNNNIKGTSTLRNSGNGIHAWKCANIYIKNNYITGQRDGIYFEFVQRSKVEQNISEHNMRYGLHFMFSNDNSYLLNTFKNNQAGVAVMYSKRITMLNNRFKENWGSSIYGLLLKEILDSRIENNIFYKNTSAIFMESCNRNTILNNDFLNNGWAIRMLSSCEDNVVSKNNFSGNTFDVTTNGELLENKFSNNYWDKYEGYDLNKDGIGDIPYRPISLYAQIIERVPQSVILMRSFIVNLLDKVERSIPSITPLSVKDDSPQMKPWKRSYKLIN